MKKRAWKWKAEAIESTGKSSKNQKTSKDENGKVIRRGNVNECLKGSQMFPLPSMAKVEPFFLRANPNCTTY